MLFFIYFYGRLMLRPRLTEVRETFTRGVPWVWIEKLLLGLFSWSSLNYRVGQKVTKFGIFSDPARKLSALTPERGRILYFWKKLVKCRWLLYTRAAFGELWRTNPWDPRATKFFKKWHTWIACDRSYFRLLDASTTTPEPLNLNPLIPTP